MFSSRINTKFAPPFCRRAMQGVSRAAHAPAKAPSANGRGSAGEGPQAPSRPAAQPVSGSANSAPSSVRGETAPEAVGSAATGEARSESQGGAGTGRAESGGEGGAAVSSDCLPPLENLALGSFLPSSVSAEESRADSAKRPDADAELSSGRQALLSMLLRFLRGSGA